MHLQTELFNEVISNTVQKELFGTFTTFDTSESDAISYLIALRSFIRNFYKESTRNISQSHGPP
jgi:hypothetical protein